MKSTLAAKVIEGFHSQGWQALGYGGTWAGAMRPLEVYIQRKVERAVKAEREACAKLIEPSEEHRRDASWGYIGGEEGVEMLDAMAAKIRAREP